MTIDNVYDNIFNVPEKTNIPPFAVSGSQGTSEFGPTPGDIADYSELLSRLDAGEEFRFNPRVNAELTSTLIDRVSLGCFINGDVGENGLDTDSRLKVSQQRYIAGVLGLNVGTTEINASSHTATTEVALPELDSLPDLPARTSYGKSINADGAEISQVQSDAIYAAHFIANNSSHFRKPGAFEELFGRVVQQAEGGTLEVGDKAGDPRGAMSLVRQVANVMGYKVQKFSKGSDGKFTAQVDGIRAGFDSQHTHFKRPRTRRPT